MNRRLSNLPQGRGPVVILSLHDEKCTPCDEYADALQRAESLKDWDARVLVRYDDKELTDITPAALVADEFGEVFYERNTEHGFVPVEEVAEWVRFVAIQCPECEVAEEPWRSL